jgi:hypothetical protein
VPSQRHDGLGGLQDRSAADLVSPRRPPSGSIGVVTSTTITPGRRARGIKRTSSPSGRYKAIGIDAEALSVKAAGNPDRLDHLIRSSWACRSKPQQDVQAVLDGMADAVFLKAACAGAVSSTAVGTIDDALFPRPQLVRTKDPISHKEVDT